MKKYVISFIVFLITFYQKAISPHMGGNCRYYPSCSEYVKKAIKTHGFWGILMGFKRMLSCNPWGGHGYDPVPEKKKNLKNTKKQKVT